MEQITISVIVPAYNIDQYLPRCLDSLLVQTHSNLEIIVVDDGSTDKTAMVIEEYVVKDSRIKSIHKRNGGVSSARVEGIYASIGEYIGFVDGDDYIEPEMFEYLLKNAVKYDADISHCGYQMIFPDGHIDMYYNTRRKELFDKEQGLRAILSGDYVEPGIWNKLYRRDIVVGFEKSRIWDGTLKYTEDLLMNYILFSRAKNSVYEDIPYYHYMLRSQSATTSKKKYYQIYDPQVVMKTILNDVSEESSLYTIVLERYLRVLIGIAQQEEWKEDAVEARRILKGQFGNIHRNGISKKLHIMVFGVVYLQPLYTMVRKIYNFFTGMDKKYNLE